MSGEFRDRCIRLVAPFLEQGFDVEAIAPIDGVLAVADRDDGRAHPGQPPSGVPADVAEALHGDARILEIVAGGCNGPARHLCNAFARRA